VELPRKYVPLEIVFDVHRNARVVDDWTVLVFDSPRVLDFWFSKVLVLWKPQIRTEIRTLTEKVDR
jgi:hypothetical protein